MEDYLYMLLLNHLQIRLQPSVSLISHLDVHNPGIPLLTTAIVFDYVVVSERRYWASSSSKSSNHNSIMLTFSSGGRRRVGELVNVIAVQQPALGIQRFGHVQ